MKKWELLNKESGKGLSIDNITKILLDNRGIKTKKEIDEFLDPKFEDVTVDSVGINKNELAKALRRINEAVDKNEKIIIFGDYDVDGICGTAILWETIYGFYKNVFPYIPHRVEEGYGLSIHGIDNIIHSTSSGQESQISSIRQAQDKNVKLIITVDNGIVAKEAVDHANKNGIDVILTDHHVGADKFPDAYAMVHTTRLCGAGIAYLLSREIRSTKSEIRNKSKIQNSNFQKTFGSQDDNHLELVAIATVADLVPLLGPNRTLVKFGLEKLRDTKRMGLLELFKEAGIAKKTIGVYEIGHIIAPRLNAMGRLLSAMDSVRLLCTKDVQRASKLAQILSSTNRERQIMTDESAEHAKSILSGRMISSKIAFVAHTDYNQGVIGLIASKLVEEFYRPSFAISIGETLSKGSARSIRGVNIIELIRSVSHTLVQVGGHPMAAGFTVETKRLEEFRQALEQKASEAVLDDYLFRTLQIDMPLSLSDVSLELYKRLQDLAPFGIGNSEPVFMTKDVIIEDMRLLGKEKNHMKLRLSQAHLESRNFDAIAFNMAEKASYLRIGDKIDVAYTIDLNEWNGNRKLQLKVRDLQSLMED